MGDDRGNVYTWKPFTLILYHTHIHMHMHTHTHTHSLSTHRQAFQLIELNSTTHLAWYNTIPVYIISSLLTANACIVAKYSNAKSSTPSPNDKPLT